MLRYLWMLPIAAIALIYAPLRAQENQETSYIGEVFDGNDAVQITVNLRAGDGINYRILRVVNEGQEVIVLGQRGDWLKIQLPEGSEVPVWVKTEYLDISGQQATVNADRVNLRADKTVRSTSLLSLNQGDTVEVIEGVTGPWTKIKAPAGIVCWISAKYVRHKSDIVKEEATVDPLIMAAKEGDAAEEDLLADGNEASTSETEMDAEATAEATDVEEESSEDPSDVKRIRKIYEEMIADLKNKKAEEYSESVMINAPDNFKVEGTLRLADEMLSGAAYTLVDKARILFYLKSARDDDRRKLFDLNKYVDQRVSLTGMVTMLDSGNRLIEVKQIELLESSE